MAKKVFVGLSGGVDSSVSAYLLQKEGYDVTGVFIKVWQPDFINCTWREDRLDAMRICAKLNIPFKTLDLEEVYKKEVIDYMLREYEAGNTPNPDVYCNKEVKFGAFLKWALKNGADYIATGHYARIIKDDNGIHKLLRGKDDSKDQSYFLWTLKQNELSRIIFPIGHLTKVQVRELALKANLVTANKKDSQGLCFISNVDMKEFLKHFIPHQKGNVLNLKGEIIGEHDGVSLYTIGERHGFKIKNISNVNLPNYIVSKDTSNNTITVSNDTKNVSYRIIQKNRHLEEINWISGCEPMNRTLTAETRYRGTLINCNVIGNSITFENEENVAVGQSIVFYREDECLGGAIIR